MAEPEEHDINHSEEALISLPQNEDLRKIEIERRRLLLDKEKFVFEQEKIKGDLELQRMRSALKLDEEKSRVQLATLKSTQELVQSEKIEHYREQRRISNRSSWFKMGVSTVLITSGIWLISKGDNLGPYLLGTGAGGAGIQSVSGLLPKKTDKDSESIDSKPQNKDYH